MHATAVLSRPYSLTAQWVCRTVETISHITTTLSVHGLRMSACQGMPALICSRRALASGAEDQGSACVHASAFPLR